MKKSMIATLITATMFAASASGGGRSAAAQPTADPEVGTCSSLCSSNHKRYLDRTSCVSACSGTCDVDVC
jgi:hypothetical protein